MNRQTIEIYVPHGYESATEFLHDCNFEPVEMPVERWTITSRAKLSERIFWAFALLFRWPKRDRFK